MTIIDEITERRMIAAMILESAVLAAACDLELYDFTDYRLWLVLAAIRQLQTENADVTVDDIAAVLESQDHDKGTRYASLAGYALLGELVLDWAPYREAILWDHDIAWLRELSRRRRRLEEIA